MLWISEGDLSYNHPMIPVDAFLDFALHVFWPTLFLFLGSRFNRHLCIHVTVNYVSLDLRRPTRRSGANTSSSWARSALRVNHIWLPKIRVSARIHRQVNVRGGVRFDATTDLECIAIRRLRGTNPAETLHSSSQDSRCSRSKCRRPPDGRRAGELPPARSRATRMFSI